MAIRKTDAFILKTQPFRTSSLIVTFFTRDFGKIKGVAKGVRLERELRGALFELFNQVEVIFYEKQKSDLHLISETFLLESYEPVRAKIETIGAASYYADLVDQLTEFHDPHEPIYHLLAFAFRYLSTLSPPRLTRIFETHLLREVGWLPYLDGCVQCGGKNLSETFFSPVQGALYCSRCAPSAKDARALTEETLDTLRYYIHHDPEESVKRRLTAQTEQGLAALLGKFFEARLHRPLKSRIFLEKIRSVAALANL